MSSSLSRNLRRTQAAAAEQRGAAPDLAALGAAAVVRAFRVLESIIEDATATAATRLRAIAMLFDRVYGRPRAAAKAAPPPQTINFVSSVPDLSREEWMEKWGKPEPAKKKP